MFTISKQQAFDRWDSLPENLRDELVSEVNSNFIWQACEAEHVPDEKIYTVSKLAGAVLMGFLHPEDMANEIRDALSIDIRIATSIANAISQRIFAPLRSDIDKIYNPNLNNVAAPKILEEIRPPIAELIPTATLARLSSVSPTATAPTPKITPPAPPKPATSLDEFARDGENTVPALAPAAPPKPVVLQTESIARPIPNAPDFRVPTIAENIMGKNASAPLSSRPAVIEFGGPAMPKTPSPLRPPITPKVTVTRYGSENSAAPVKPPTPEPMRTITEITPEALKTIVPTPKPPAKPSFTPISQIPIPSPIAPKSSVSSVSKSASPMPPAPPKPIPQTLLPVGQPEKVIQKDYSEEKK